MLFFVMRGVVIVLLHCSLRARPRPTAPVAARTRKPSYACGQCPKHRSGRERSRRRSFGTCGGHLEAEISHRFGTRGRRALDCRLRKSGNLMRHESQRGACQSYEHLRVKVHTLQAWGGTAAVVCCAPCIVRPISVLRF